MTSTYTLSLVADPLLEASSIRSYLSVQSAGRLVPEQSRNLRLELHPELTAETCSTEIQDDAIEQVSSTQTCQLAPLHTLLSVTTCSCCQCSYCHLHLMFPVSKPCRLDYARVSKPCWCDYARVSKPCWLDYAGIEIAEPALVQAC